MHAAQCIVLNGDDESTEVAGGHYSLDWTTAWTKENLTTKINFLQAQ